MRPRLLAGPRTLLLAAALAALAACTDAADDPPVTPDAAPASATGDRDQDGVPDADDCAPDDRETWHVETLYVDADDDNRGAGEPIRTCEGARTPHGMSAVGSDCNDLDASVWQLLPYSYRDADGDGATVPSSGTLCTGARLPEGYSDQPNGNDVDDGDASRQLVGDDGVSR